MEENSDIFQLGNFRSLGDRDPRVPGPEQEKFPYRRLQTNVLLNENHASPFTSVLKEDRETAVVQLR